MYAIWSIESHATSKDNVIQNIHLSVAYTHSLTHSNDESIFLTLFFPFFCCCFEFHSVYCGIYSDGDDDGGGGGGDDDDAAASIECQNSHFH